MGYGIKELADAAGVTTRALRYYEEEGLLAPERDDANGYRIYSAEDADRLHDIMLLRELGLGLTDIKQALLGTDRGILLENHLIELRNKRDRIDALIMNVENTILEIKGEKEMTDSEKFACFKREAISENERRFGREARERYGDEAVDAANAKFAAADKADFENTAALEAAYKEKLKEAAEAGDPSSEAAREAVKLHGEWIKRMWGDGMFSKSAHLALIEGYEADSRFTSYYENITPGGAAFLAQAAREYYRAED